MREKDYLLLARGLAKARPLAIEGVAARDLWEWARYNVALELGQDNPRFSRDKFYAATF